MVRISKAIVWPIVTAEEKIMPITAERTPCKTAFTTCESRIISTKRDNNTVSTAGGVNMATVATVAPQKPATR